MTLHGDLLKRFRAGNIPALARAISIVEDERAGFEELLHEALQEGPSVRRPSWVRESESVWLP
jgi:putative protein kinase ArgK-like GTPase of G3E family